MVNVLRLPARPIAAKDIPAFIEKLDGDAGRIQTKLAAKLLRCCC